MKSKWDKIIIARIAEGVLTVLAFGIGLWHTIESKTLEEELDSQFENESENEDKE